MRVSALSCELLKVLNRVLWLLRHGGALSAVPRMSHSPGQLLRALKKLSESSFDASCVTQFELVVIMSRVMRYGHTEAKLAAVRGFRYLDETVQEKHVGILTTAMVEQHDAIEVGKALVTAFKCLDMSLQVRHKEALRALLVHKEADVRNAAKSAFENIFDEVITLTLAASWPI